MTFLQKISSDQQEFLKLLGVLLMTLDHIVAVQNDYPHLFHYLGRTVMPLFAYLLVYNFINRTSNKKKYITKILIVGIISQPIFEYAIIDEDPELNILFTLGIGIAFLYAHELIQKKATLIQIKAALYTALFLIVYLIGFKVSYHHSGLITIFAFYAYLKNPNPILAILLLLAIISLNSLLTSNEWLGFYGLLLFPIVYLIKKTNFKVIRMPGWLFYAFYPAHLLIIKLIVDL